MLKAVNISKSYETPTGSVDVLSGLDLEIAPGQTLSLMGDSGCGKSTLLHVLTGLDTLSSGELWLDNVRIDQLGEKPWSHLRRDRIGLVFQHFNLIPSLTIRQNISFHGALAGSLDAGTFKSVTDHLGLAPLLDRRPEELSGGQQQRAAIARTLIAKPDYIFADEPTGNLDEGSSKKVLELMLDIVRETGAALFMVTHSKSLAADLSTQLVLKGGVCCPIGGAGTGPQKR